MRPMTTVSNLNDDAAFIADITEYLAARGYKVTKARATSTEPAPSRADGAEPVKVKASKRHSRCAAHFRVPGMREPVCIAPDRDETGAPIPAEWSNADTVLAFAVDVATRAEAHRNRASTGYTGADQSGADVGYRSTYNAELARKVTTQYRMRTEPHTFAPRNGYQYATECEACGTDKREQVHAIEAAA